MGTLGACSKTSKDNIIQWPFQVSKKFFSHFKQLSESILSFKTVGLVSRQASLTGEKKRPNLPKLKAVVKY